MVDFSAFFPQKKGYRLVGVCWYVNRMFYPSKHRHLHPRDWVFDYSWVPGGSTRAGSERAPWRERPARCGHLYPPGCPYWEHAPAEGLSVTGGWVIFRHDAAFGLEALIDPRCGYARFLDPEGLVAEHLEDMGKTGARSGMDAYWRVFGRFCMALDLLHGSNPGDGETRMIGGRAEPESLSDRALAHMRGHLGEALCLDSLAAALGVSESTLSHRFREETGQSPMQAFLALRIDAARALVLRGDRLEAIARQTGFGDAFHLSRTFKRLTGVPPSAYRAGRLPSA